MNYAAAYTDLLRTIKYLEIELALKTKYLEQLRRSVNTISKSGISDETILAANTLASLAIDENALPKGRH